MSLWTVEKMSNRDFGRINDFQSNTSHRIARVLVAIGAWRCETGRQGQGETYHWLSVLGKTGSGRLLSTLTLSHPIVLDLLVTCHHQSFILGDSVLDLVLTRRFVDLPRCGGRRVSKALPKGNVRSTARRKLTRH